MKTKAVADKSNDVISGSKNGNNTLDKSKSTGNTTHKKASGATIPNVEIKHPLSKRNIKHIQTRYNVDSIKSQAEYLSDAQLAEKLKDQSFFNSKWTTDEITKYSEIAYNDLLNQGKTGGLFEYSINGEKLNVYIHNDGTFGSVYGNHTYSMQDIRNFMK